MKRQRLLIDSLFHPVGRWISGALLLGAALMPTGTIHQGPVLCLFRYLTDLHCPGCGITRSLVHFCHGDFALAFQFHLFGPFLFSFMLMSFVLAFIPSHRRQGMGAENWLRLYAAIEPALFVNWGIWAAWRLARELSEHPITLS